MKYSRIEIRTKCAELNIDNCAIETRRAVCDAAKKEFGSEAELEDFLLRNGKAKEFDKYAFVNQKRIGWGEMIRFAADSSEITMDPEDMQFIGQKNLDASSYRKKYNACVRWLNAHPRLHTRIPEMPE